MAERDVGNLRAQASVVVRATADEVFTALADTPTWPTWQAVDDARWVSEPPYCVGSRRTVGLPGRVTFLEEFIAWEPAVRMAFTLIGMDGPGARLLRGGVEVMDLEALDDDRTRLTYTLRIDLAIPTPVARFLVAPGANRTLDRALRTLAAQLNSG